MAKQKSPKLKNNKMMIIVAAVAAVVVFGGVGAWLLTSSSAGAACTQSPEERRGSASAKCTRYIQEMLRINNGATIAVDGSFGQQTEAAVAAFQSASGVRAKTKAGNLQTYGPISRDGRVGPNTWKKLCSALAKAGMAGVSQAKLAENESRLATIKADAGCGLVSY